MEAGPAVVPQRSITANFIKSRLFCPERAGKNTPEGLLFTEFSKSAMTCPMTEQRLIDIETKIAHQEYLIEELNQVIYTQQKTIDRLEHTLTSLAKRFKEAMSTENEIRGPDEKPPHY